MISFQKRFLFVHIPKTAGNSIQSILRNYSEDQIVALRSEQDGIERFGLRNPNYKIRKHSTLAEYRMALGDEQFRSLYKFACVRNPWDRMVSYYFRPTQQAMIGCGYSARMAKRRRNSGRARDEPAATLHPLTPSLIH